MTMIKIKINNKEYSCEEGKTILEVARENNIFIPTLCYLKNVCEESNCRICMVEMADTGRLVTSCSTKVADGMSVYTDSEKVYNSRKNTLKLIRTNHICDCSCPKDGECDLQNLFHDYDVKAPTNDYEVKHYAKDTSSACIVRDNEKCILCGRCVSVCANTQQVYALTKQQRGFETFVGCAYNTTLDKSTCIGCGQCTLVCPTGALTEKSEVELVKKAIRDPQKKVFAQIAPAVRVSIAEAFGNPIGTFDENKMVEALRLLGFDKVFDVNIGADFTVLEEGAELIERIQTKKNLPLFSSCCPGWFKFLQTQYPEFDKHLSSCKSPTEMLGALVKNYYAEKEGLDKDNVVVVDIMPCTGKKQERHRAKDVDYVITTRELAKMIKSAHIDYNNLKGQQFDSPLSNYSGAGLIFGVTGGVTEAVLRHASALLDGKNSKVDFTETRLEKGRKEVEVTCGDIKLHLCIVSGLGNAKDVLEEIKAGTANYDFVEVMACPGGCINGGGQNYVDYSKIDVDTVKRLRAEAIYNHDRNLTLRVSKDNVDMQKVYDEYLGKDKKRAHELLHWRHED